MATSQGSFEVPVALVEDRRLAGGPVLAYMSLAFHATSGVVTISASDLAEEMECSVFWARKGIEKLERFGYIAELNRNEYQLIHIDSELFGKEKSPN